MMDKPPTLINICNGPGCNAWNAPEILKNLPETIQGFVKDIKICEAACMSKCGGGVTVQVNGNSDNLIKVRRPHQAVDKIIPSIAAQPALKLGY